MKSINVLVCIGLYSSILGCQEKENKTVDDAGKPVVQAKADIAKTTTPQVDVAVPQKNLAEPVEVVAQAQKTSKPGIEEKSLSVRELWALYKSKRAEAKSLEKVPEYQKASLAYVEAAEAAEKLKKPGIASWQHNSAGKNLIDAFKGKVNYDEVMNALNTMKYSPEKKAYKKQSKENFKINMTLLQSAIMCLNKAEKFDAKTSEAKRLGIIQKNKAFIRFIETFIVSED
jgi:hypothetical protein